MTLIEWVKENLADDIKNIAEHGCDSGYTGIIYYHETIALYETYFEEIWGILNTMAEDYSFLTTMAFITSTNYAKHIYDDATFKNYMVWMAIENICFNLVGEEEGVE